MATRNRENGRGTHYGCRKFNGIVNWVEIDLGADAKGPDHFISPKKRLYVAMALQ